MDTEPQSIDKPRPRHIIEDELLAAARIGGIFLFLVGCFFALFERTGPVEPPSPQYDYDYNFEVVTPSELAGDPSSWRLYLAPGLLLFAVSSVVLAMRWWADRRRMDHARKTGRPSV